MIRPFGEAALLVETGDAERAQALAADLGHQPIAGVIGTVPGAQSVLVEIEPGSDPHVATELESRVAGIRSEPATGRRRVIPVVYGGEWGPDLSDVAALSGLPEDAVVHHHASAELRVLFGGFAPGFAYLGDLTEPLRVPRLETPRSSTPAGSVAIAGSMSGIYPAALPGGWRVIGRTPVTLFDVRRDPPAYLVPGDVVRFQRIEASDWERFAGAPDDW